MSKINFGVCVTRVNQYRALGALAEAAASDLRFSVRHIFPPAEEGVKGYLSPKAENIPTAFKGSRRLHFTKCMDSFRAALRECAVVISTTGKCFVFGEEQRCQNLLWVAVEDCAHSAQLSHRFDDSDIAAWSGKRNYQIALEYLNKSQLIERKKKLEAISVFTGWTRFDAIKKMTRKEARISIGIETKQPVVFYNPDGYRFTPDFQRNLDGVLFRMHTDLYDKIWCENRLLKRVYNATKSSTIPLRYALNMKFSEKAMLKAIRDFCDRNHAVLIMAPRRKKDTVGKIFSEWEENFQDDYMRFSADYPQSFLTACYASDLVISGYRSEACMDAAVCGVPYITVIPPDVCYHPKTWDVLKQYYDGDTLDCEGCAWTKDALDFIEQMPRKNLNDFEINKVRHKAYSEKIIGTSDGNASIRLLNIIYSRLASSKKI